MAEFRGKNQNMKSIEIRGAAVTARLNFGYTYALADRTSAAAAALLVEHW